MTIQPIAFYLYYIHKCNLIDLCIKRRPALKRAGRC